MRFKRMVRRLAREEDGFMPPTWGAVTILVALAALMAIAGGTAAMVHQKQTQQVGGVTFEEVTADPTAKPAPKPAAPAAEPSTSSQSDPAPVVQQQPVPQDDPSGVIVLNGGDGTGIEDPHDGTSSSSSSSSSTGSHSGGDSGHDAGSGGMGGHEDDE